MTLSRSLKGSILLAVAVALIVRAPGTGPAVPVAAAPSQQPAVTVFAASSLTDAFKDIGAAFETEKGVPVTFNFGASTALRTQLEQGASADVFASADQTQMDNARKSGAINGADVTFAKNRLVLIAPKDNPGNLQSVADVARPGVKLVTAAPEVPIGVYTQNMFDKMSTMDLFGANFKDRANANIVSREPNVRQVVAKVQLGEADAAVVYFTDVTPQADTDLLVIPIPDDLNTLATYPIALVANGPQSELGQAFVDMVTGPGGQSILQRWNFGTVGPTMLVPAPTSDRLAPVQAAR